MKDLVQVIYNSKLYYRKTFCGRWRFKVNCIKPKLRHQGWFRKMRPTFRENKYHYINKEKKLKSILNGSNFLQVKA